MEWQEQLQGKLGLSLAVHHMNPVLCKCECTACLVGFHPWMVSIAIEPN